jgi:sulfhydrogenase subunit delta
MNNKTKFRLGVYKYTCCAGCEFQLIYFQKYILEIFENLEIIYFRMGESGGAEDGPFDLVLIDGAITEAWQADQLKKVRRVTKFLFPIGSCAVNGGIPAIKNHTSELEMERRVYKEISPIHSMKTHPVAYYVRVDGCIRGCPMGETDLVEAVTSLLLGKRPNFFNYSVCVECKLKGNLCVLVAHKEPCMGPVTNAGCGALCPSYNRACYACWGPMEDANAPALARQFEKMGLSSDDIFRKFTQYGSPMPEFRRGAELYGSTT